MWVWETLYLQPNGSPQRLIKKIQSPDANVTEDEIAWYLESQPYWKVQRVLTALPPERVEGWVLTEINGVKHIYGDIDFTVGSDIDPSGPDIKKS